MSVENLAPPAEALIAVEPVDQVQRIANQDPIGYIAARTGLAHGEVEQFREQAEMRVAGGRVAARMSEEAFTDMLGQGRYKTFRETGRSAGHGATVAGPQDGYWLARDTYESLIFGQAPDDEPIVYGFLEETDTLPSRQEVKGSFGNVEIILRPEVRERASFTVGESLGNYVPPLSYPDAMLARQAIDSAKQRGKSIARSKDSYMEAQVFGGVTMDDVEMVAIDSTGLEKSMQLIETVHANYPELPVMLRLPAGSSQLFQGPKILDTAHKYPFVQFVGQVEAPSPFRTRNYLEGVDGSEEFIDRTEQSYEQAQKRIAQLQAKAAEYWQQEHPGEAFPPNVSFDMLSTDY